MVTFNRQWVGVGLFSPPAVSTSRPVGQNWTSIGSTSRVCWAAGLAVDTAGGENKPTPTHRQATLCFAHRRV